MVRVEAAETFQSSLTRRRPFTCGDGTQVDADMMAGRLHISAFGQGRGWSATRLPYAGGKLAMTVVLPRSALDELERSLHAAVPQAILTAPRPVPILLFTMPGWKFLLAAPLQDPLTALGMPKGFNPMRAPTSAA